MVFRLIWILGIQYSDLHCLVMNLTLFSIAHAKGLGVSTPSMGKGLKLAKMLTISTSLK